MHTTLFVLACCLILVDSRRTQTINVDDGSALDQERNAYSLAQLVQTAIRKEEKIKQDFLAILRKDPDWKNMIDAVAVVDHMGSMLIGQEGTKWMCKLLRQVAKKFVIKNITVDFAESQETISEWMNGKRKQQHSKSTGALEAKWKLQLGDKGLEEPILVEAHTVFDFNIANKLVFVQLTSVFVNGVSLSVWPEVSAEQNSAYNLMKIQEWMRDIQPVTTDAQEKLQIGDLKSTEQAEMVIETMKEEFANIFRKEPSFSVFSENLVVADHEGHESSGLDSNRNLFQFLRKLPEEFDVRDFHVKFMESSETHSLYIDRKLKGTSKNPHVGLAGRDGAVLLASWRLKLGPKKGRSSPLEIEGNTAFHVHKIDGLVKVDRILMVSTRVNGKELKAWPEVDMLDDLSSSLSTIKEWANSLEQEPQLVDDDVQEA